MEHKYQVIRYKQSDGKIRESYLFKDHYDIDDSIAERFIRPLAGERKNSLFFVSSRMEMYRRPIIRCSQYVK